LQHIGHEVVDLLLTLPSDLAMRLHRLLQVIGQRSGSILDTLLVPGRCRDDLRHGLGQCAAGEELPHLQILHAEGSDGGHLEQRPHPAGGVRWREWIDDRPAIGQAQGRGALGAAHADVLHGVVGQALEHLLPHSGQILLNATAKAREHGAAPVGEVGDALADEVGGFTEDLRIGKACGRAVDVEVFQALPHACVLCVCGIDIFLVSGTGILCMGGCLGWCVALRLIGCCLFNISLGDGVRDLTADGFKLTQHAISERLHVYTFREKTSE